VFLLALGALMLTSALGFAQPPSPAAPTKITGRAAIDRLVGNTMTGTLEGSPYFAFYDKDGAVRMQASGDVTAGKWAADGDDLCEEFPDDGDETCYRLELDGNSGIMTDEDGAVYKIDIIPGNPKKL